jgi:hypothetical protein
LRKRKHLLQANYICAKHLTCDFDFFFFYNIILFRLLTLNLKSFVDFAPAPAEIKIVFRMEKKLEISVTSLQTKCSVGFETNSGKYGWRDC